MDMKLSGGCLCGFIRFTAINPSSPHSCSCDMCQKHTGCQTAVWI
ncbi:TPA: GFA family protein, partial [Klebsiella variicola]